MGGRSQLCGGEAGWELRRRLRQWGAALAFPDQPLASSSLEVSFPCRCLGESEREGGKRLAGVALIPEVPKV